MGKLVRQCPAKWIAPQGWQDIIKLSQEFPEAFSALPTDIERNLQTWQEWYDLDAPEQAAFPCEYNKKLKPFEVLMFLRCFRVDRCYRLDVEFVLKSKGTSIA